MVVFMSRRRPSARWDRPVRRDLLDLLDRLDQVDRRVPLDLLELRVRPDQQVRKVRRVPRDRQGQPELTGQPVRKD